MNQLTKMEMKKKYWLFGTRNIRWGFKEFVKMYSSGEESYFSKKRVNEGISMVIFYWGAIHIMIVNVMKWDAVQFSIWAIPVVAISGYNLNQIQKEKQNVQG